MIIYVIDPKVSTENELRQVTSKNLVGTFTVDYNPFTRNSENLTVGHTQEQSAEMISDDILGLIAEWGEEVGIETEGLDWYPGEDVSALDWEQFTEGDTVVALELLVASTSVPVAQSVTFLVKELPVSEDEEEAAYTNLVEGLLDAEYGDSVFPIQMQVYKFEL